MKNTKTWILITGAWLGFIAIIFIVSSFWDKVFPNASEGYNYEESPRSEMKIDTEYYNDSVYIVRTKVDTAYADKMPSK